MPKAKISFPKGSEWRKWDLHLHAPTAALNNQFTGATDEEKWEKYLKKLESFTDISVLGITDYFSIEGYKRAQKEKEAGRLRNIDCLLPNVELRLLPVTDQNRPINIHVIFDPEIVDKLDSHFFQNLVFNYQGNEYRCDREGLIRLGRAYQSYDSLDEWSAYCAGVEQFKVSFDKLRDVLRKNKDLEARYLVAVSNRSGDGISGIQHSSLAATRQEIYRLSHLIFSSNPSDREYFLGKGSDRSNEVIQKYGSLKACVHGSDGHSLDTICQPNLGRYTWIKADPTFDGLKQIVYEPEARVQIREDNPREDHPKSHFSMIRIKGPVFGTETPKFAESTLPLNENMVAIIGGRGTGKSLLLDVLHHTFNEPPSDSKNDSSSKGRLARIVFPACKVTMTKSDGDQIEYDHAKRPNQFPYLHVRQGDVKEIAEDSNKLAVTIQELIGYIEDEIDEDFEKEIVNRNRQTDELRGWFLLKDEEENPINEKPYNERRKAQFEKLIETITTKETKNQIEEYTQNAQRSNQIARLLKEARSIRREIESFQKEINVRIEKFNQQNLLDNKTITPVDYPQIKEIEEIVKVGEEELEKLNKANGNISKKLADQGIKGDISGLLDKAESYQREIDLCVAKINEIDEQEKRLRRLKEERISSAGRIIEQINNRRESIDKKFQEKLQGSLSMKPEHKDVLKQLLKDIEITGTVKFDKKRFKEGLKEFFDGRKLRTRNIDNIFPVEGYEDFFKLLKGEPIIRTDGSDPPISLEQFGNKSDLFLNDERADFFDYFYSENKRREYLKVLPSIKYKGKEPEKLSVGQRGTFFVCLKLATEAFTAPFVFDQPEDDLDNEFIVKELRPLFREIKKYRQVIIVTHNANLVVNADAEQVVVANNDNEVISFKSGSLEDPRIRDEVCRVLEGGKEAFRQRELRYDLSRSIRSSPDA